MCAVCLLPRGSFTLTYYVQIMNWMYCVCQKPGCRLHWFQLTPALPVSRAFRRQFGATDLTAVEEELQYTSGTESLLQKLNFTANLNRLA